MYKRLPSKSCGLDEDDSSFSIVRAPPYDWLTVF